LSALALALLLAVGCAPSNPGIDIEGAVPAETGECGYMPADQFLGFGTLDTSSAALAVRPTISYVVAFQVANRFLNRGNVIYPIMADPNTWTATEAEVELRDVAGQPFALPGGLSSRYRVPAAGFVPSAIGVEPSRGIVLAEVIPATYGDALLDLDLTLLVAVRLTGTTSGDSTQQTGEYVLPVRLCTDCLFQCVLDEACLPTTASGSCVPGQDEVSFACYPGNTPPCTPAAP
jgi:hypothetical protein